MNNWAALRGWARGPTVYRMSRNRFWGGLGAAMAAGLLAMGSSGCAIGSRVDTTTSYAGAPAAPAGQPVGAEAGSGAHVTESAKGDSAGEDFGGSSSAGSAGHEPSVGGSGASGGAMEFARAGEAQGGYQAIAGSSSAGAWAGLGGGGSGGGGASGAPAVEICALAYRDFDGDGFGDPATGITACAMPSGYVRNADDCYDKNAFARPNLKPGEIVMATDRGDGSFDYDCDGLEELDFPGYADCAGFDNACPPPNHWPDGFSCDYAGMTAKAKNMSGWTPGYPIPACGKLGTFGLGPAWVNDGWLCAAPPYKNGTYQTCH